MIPEWLAETRYASFAPARSSSRRKDFVEKTVGGIVSLLRESVFSESYARKRGLMQRIDPRIKLITVAAFVVSLSIVRSIGAVIGAYLLVLVLCYFSRVQLWFFMKRVWLFVPIFTAMIAIPAIFNFVTPGKPLAVLLKLPADYSLGPWHLPKTITITEPGVKGALLFTARVATSVSAVVLLMLTTLWNELLRSLRVFRMPAVLVTIVGMTYRYVVLFLRTVEELHLARKSRTISKLTTKENRFWVAARIASTFRKSMKLSEDVHLAMISRGFDGEPRVLNGFRVRAIDVAWLVGAILVCVSLVLFTLRTGA